MNMDSHHSEEQNLKILDLNYGSARLKLIIGGLSLTLLSFGKYLLLTSTLNFAILWNPSSMDAHM